MLQPQWAHWVSIRNGSDVTRLRIFNSLWIQPTPEWSAEMIVHRAARQIRTPLAARLGSPWRATPLYAVNDNVKLQFELGTDARDLAHGRRAQRLTKLTCAPP